MHIVIENFRAGHACNSSSTHSLAWFAGEPPPDWDVEPGDDYGWNHFTASSRDAKRRYAVSNLLRGLRSWDESQGRHVLARDPGVDALLGELFPDDDPEDLHKGGVGSVDHQSEVSVPRGFAPGAPPDLEWFREYLAVLEQPGVAVLGSNDNGDEPHPAEAAAAHSRSTSFQEGSRLRSRRNEDGSWTLYEAASGSKVRMRFLPTEGIVEHVPSTRPGRPELVDVKVTGRCSHGCKYCYQSSTPEGKDADVRTLDRLAGTLAELQVFEAAIGGGEPTDFWRFKSFCEDLRRRGVTPNFTTRNLAFVKKNRGWIHEHCGAVAFSVDQADMAQRAVDALGCDMSTPSSWGRERYGGRHALQVVAGTVPRRQDFLRIAGICRDSGVRLTILGYKDVGFGADFVPLADYDWLAELAALGWGRRPDVAIDTAALAAVGAERLREHGVPQWRLEGREGFNSMYVDAVAGRVAPSSWHPPRDFRPLALDAAGFKASWEAMVPGLPAAN